MVFVYEFADHVHKSILVEHELVMLVTVKSLVWRNNVNVEEVLNDWH